jgi:hypothetical protein
MQEMTRWLAILVSVIGITTGAAAEINANSLPLTKVKNVQNKATNTIDILKSYPVNKIESGMVDSTRFVYQQLPRIPLEKWLVSILGNTPLEWKEDGCAASDINIDDNDEHCTSFLVTVRTPQWHCPEVYLSFGVETDGAVYLLNDNSIVRDFGANGGMEQIADLEKALAEVKAKMTPGRPANLPDASLKAMSYNDMIMHVRALDVHSLDRALSPERFDTWLARSARWPLQWRANSTLDEYLSRCEPKRLLIKVYPSDLYDPEKRRPPASISVDIGSWEQGIKGAPKLDIYFTDSVGIFDPSASVKNLSSLQKKLEEWNASLLLRKPIKPVPTKVPVIQTKPVVQNMILLGHFGSLRTTPSWHCYGYQLSLWQYGEHVFGTFHDFGGQCADSREPNYIVRNVKFDPRTGELEFKTDGESGYKFAGKLVKDTVIGAFLGWNNEEVKLKGGKSNNEPIPDSDKNVTEWCKVYAPKIRYVVEEELKELCKSLGVE